MPPICVYPAHQGREGSPPTPNAPPLAHHHPPDALLSLAAANIVGTGPHIAGLVLAAGATTPAHQHIYPMTDKILSRVSEQLIPVLEVRHGLFESARLTASVSCWRCLCVGGGGDVLSHAGRLSLLGCPAVLSLLGCPAHTPASQPAHTSPTVLGAELHPLLSPSVHLADVC